MSDVVIIEKSIHELKNILGVCISDIAKGAVYARTQTPLAIDVVNLIKYLETQLPKKVVKKAAPAAKVKGSVKEL